MVLFLLLGNVKIGPLSLTSITLTVTFVMFIFGISPWSVAKILNLYELIFSLSSCCAVCIVPFDKTIKGTIFSGDNEYVILLLSPSSSSVALTSPIDVCAL
jgi:hypothetical protein